MYSFVTRIKEYANSKLYLDFVFENNIMTINFLLIDNALDLANSATRAGNTHGSVLRNVVEKLQNRKPISSPILTHFQQNLPKGISMLSLRPSLLKVILNNYGSLKFELRIYQRQKHRERQTNQVITSKIGDINKSIFHKIRVTI